MQLQITHVGRVAPAQAPSLQPRALQPRQAVARRQRAAVTVQANFLANLFNEGKVKTAVAAAGPSPPPLPTAPQIQLQVVTNAASQPLLLYSYAHATATYAAARHCGPRRRAHAPRLVPFPRACAGEYDAAATRALIDKYIAENPVGAGWVALCSATRWARDPALPHTHPHS